MKTAMEFVNVRARTQDLSRIHFLWHILAGGIILILPKKCHGTCKFTHVSFLQNKKRYQSVEKGVYFSVHPKHTLQQLLFSPRQTNKHFLVFLVSQKPRTPTLVYMSLTSSFVRHVSQAGVQLYRRSPMLYYMSTTSVHHRVKIHVLHTLETVLVLRDTSFAPFAPTLRLLSLPVHPHVGLMLYQ